MTALVALALAIGLLAVIAWGRRRRPAPAPPQTFLVDGTTWLVQEGQLVGPCCEACRVQAMARPLAADRDGAARYELCCPRCGQVPARRAFTLQELLDLERVAATAWARSRSASPLVLSSRPR